MSRRATLCRAAEERPELDAIAVVNVVMACVSIVFGALGFLWPNFALGALKLATVDGHNDGKSEIRAASGGAFVALGAAGLLFGALQPIVWVMVGVHYAGAAVGRVLSIFADDAGSQKMWMFFAIEVIFAAWFIGANWSAAWM